MGWKRTRSSADCDGVQSEAVPAGMLVSRAAASPGATRLLALITFARRLRRDANMAMRPMKETALLAPWCCRICNLDARF